MGGGLQLSNLGQEDAEGICGVLRIFDRVGLGVQEHAKNPRVGLVLPVAPGADDALEVTSVWLFGGEQDTESVAPAERFAVGVLSETAGCAADVELGAQDFQLAGAQQRVVQLVAVVVRLLAYQLEAEHLAFTIELFVIAAGPGFFLAGYTAALDQFDEPVLPGCECCDVGQVVVDLDLIVLQRQVDRALQRTTEGRRQCCWLDQRWFIPAGIWHVRSALPFV